MEMDASRARKLQEEAIENVIIIALRLSGADILGPSTIDTSVVLQEALSPSADESSPHVIEVNGCQIEIQLTKEIEIR
ncbi:MAG: hypothetical protein FRX49_01861 [Trebouxia sp. A1-2]|nr:MAG: hypothetical protein FRX49_01861 [Trebouxia sp. A1-2]